MASAVSSDSVYVLDPTLFAPLPDANGDTLTTWATAKMVYEDQSLPAGTPAPVFAADSVPLVLQFRSVGQKRIVDTVRLTMKKL